MAKLTLKKLSGDVAAIPDEAVEQLRGRASAAPF